MALDFVEASGDLVNHGSAASLDNLDPFTVMMWVNIGTLTNNRVLWAKSTTASNGKIGRIKADGDIQGLVRRDTTDSNYITSDTPLSTNTWHFIVWVYNSGAGAGEVQNIYAGSLTALAVESAYATSDDGAGDNDDDSAIVFTGGNLASTNLAADSQIAVIAYLSVALTLGQIRSWQFRPRKLANMVLFSHYGYQGVGTQPDLSGNGNNGAVTTATQVDHVPLGPPFGFDLEWQGAFVAAVAAADLPGRSFPRGAMRGELRGVA